jgi:NAD(P)H-dependent FMN reductase
MTGAVLAGTRSEGIDGVEVITMDPLAPDPLAVFRAGAVILGTPTNFGYMSGALKHFFDEIYRPLLDRTRGKPFSFYVKGATDTDGCVHAIGTITTGLGWREAAPPVVVTGDLTETHLAACFELGAQMAASLAEGLW